MSRIAVTVTLLLAFVAVVLGAFIYSVTREPVLSDEELKERGVFVLPTPREIVDVDMVTHTGEPFTEADLEGDWSFLFFGFTNCPDICPTSMAVMAQAEQVLEEESPERADAFQGILVSVDPERDDQQTLARYVRAFSEDFMGVRGSIEETAEFATQVNVAFAKVPSEDGEYEVDHTGNIIIVNPRGHYHGFIRMPHEAETIVSAFRSLEARF
ncbi:MAG: SCO family protein [Pseudomonadota bacterium]